MLPSDLAEGAIFAKDVEKLLGGDLEGKIPDKDDAVDLGREAHLI